MSNFEIADEISKFYVLEKSSKSFAVPLDESEHISLILGSLQKIYSADLDTFFCFHKFPCTGKNPTREGLRDLIDPLYKFLSAQIIEKIEEIEHSEGNTQIFGGDYVACNKQETGGNIITVDNSELTVTNKTK